MQYHIFYQINPEKRKKYWIASDIQFFHAIINKRIESIYLILNGYCLEL